VRFLVTSAGRANGGGYGAVLGFDCDGKLLGAFGGDPRITDPRGLCLDPSGALVYINSGERALPAGIVPFPRGFGFAGDGRLYLASGVGPSGEGDNTIVAFDREGVLRQRRLVADPELSPLDLTIAPNGNIVVASEFPFGAADAVTSVREYDAASGQLVRVFVPDPALEFKRPRGLRFGPADHLYCVGEDHVVVFDFQAGDFLGPPRSARGCLTARSRAQGARTAL